MQLDAAALRISSPVLMSVLKPDHTAAPLLLNVTSPPVPLASHPPPALLPRASLPLFHRRRLPLRLARATPAGGLAAGQLAAAGSAQAV